MASIEPTEADHVRATLEWAQEHGKTAEQMRHLTAAEQAEVRQLAYTKAVLRVTAQTPGSGLQWVNVSTVKEPGEDGNLDEVRQAIWMRIQKNLQETRHPFHHRTADGTIVDEDPTLLHWIGKLTDALPAVPVNRTFYGFDPYQ
jgi:hypothetical protein